MSDRNPAHPDPDQLEAFGRGRIDLAARAEIERHLATCDSCCRTLKTMPEAGAVTLPHMACPPPRVPPAPGRDLGETAVGPTEAGSLGFEIPSSFVLSGAAPTEPEVRKQPATSEPPRGGSEVPADLAEHPRYRIVRGLGSGGMGAVFLAEHRLMHRPVAVKVIKRDLTGHEDLVERFHREVRAAARLSHPNIVAAYDAEQAGATHFLVMEYIEGTDLAHVVQRRGPLPAQEACDYARQVALGLQQAHDHGLIHRDIKPQNLMLTPRGQIKILDFGLARLADEAGTAVTSSGTVVGTADYIAPEQADDSRATDIRTDIYSLGCTLYYLLAGHPPFPGGTLMQKLRAHAERCPRPLSTIRTDLAPGLESVLERMMAKDPARRYQTPAEVARALAPYVATETAATVEMTRPAGTAAAAMLAQDAPTVPLPRADRKPDGVDHNPSTTWAEPVPSPRRHRPGAPAAAVLLLGFGLLALGIYRIQTDQGELIIESEDPDVEVVVKQGGKLVTILDPKTEQTVELREGEYQVTLDGDQAGLRLSPSTFTLTRGEREIVRIRRVPAPQPVERPPAGKAVGEVRRFEGHQDIIWRVAFSPDGRRALTGSGGHYDRGRFGPGADWTVRLWDVESGRELRRFPGHGDWVEGVDFSPGGRYALSASKDQTLRVWDLETGRELRRIPCPKSRCAAFSPDGRRILSGGFDAVVRLWDVESGRELRRFVGHTSWIRNVAFSPDGRRALSASRDRTLRLWDVETGSELRRFEGHEDQVEDVAFSPDGRHAVSGGEDRILRLWDVETGQELRRIKGHKHRITGVAFCPEGRRALSSAWDGTVRLWEVETGQELHRFEAPTAELQCLACAPDGRSALTGGYDHTARLWRLPDPAGPGAVAEIRRLPESPGDDIVLSPHLPKSGDEIRRFEGHASGIPGLALAPDGRRVLSGSQDRTVRLWDVATGRELRRFDGHRNWVWSVAFSPDGRRALSASADKTVRLWDVESGRELSRFEGHQQVATHVAFSPDGRHAVSGGRDGTVRLWEVETGRELRTFGAQGSAGRGLALAPDGHRLLSGGSDRVIRLWDVESGRELSRLRGHAEKIHRVTISPDGRRALSTGAERTMWLWDLEGGRELRRFPGPTGGFQGVAFCPNGRRALVGGEDRAVWLWDLETGEELHRFEGHTDVVWGVLFTPDGRHAVSSSKDHTIRLWQLPGPTPVGSVGEIRRFEGHLGPVTWAAFSPSGRTALSVGYDRTVRLWEVDSGKELRRLVGHTKAVWRVAYSPDGRRALSGGEDEIVRLWDLEEGRELRRLMGHNPTISSVGFTSDGRRALSSSWDRTIRIWDVEDGRELRRVGFPAGNPTFCPDGRHALVGTLDGTVHLWDVEGGRGLRRMEGHAGDVIAVASSPDGRRALSGGADATVRLWDVEAGTELRRLHGHRDAVRCVAFSPDGRRALSGGGDQLRDGRWRPGSDYSLRLWDLETGALLRRLVGHRGPINGVAYSRDGRLALSAGLDGTLRLWPLPDPAPEASDAARRAEGPSAPVPPGGSSAEPASSPGR